MTTITKLTGEEESILSAMDNEFMIPDIEEGDWHKVDGTAGTSWFPADNFTADEATTEYDGEADTVETIHGYGARLSAPGYLDCTDWTVFATYEEAARYLVDTYGNDVEIGAVES